MRLPGSPKMERIDYYGDGESFGPLGAEFNSFPN